MAVMYPRVFPLERARNPRLKSEREVFLALATQLDDSWHVFYNVLYQFRNYQDRTSHGEADFVVVHPDFHILCLEVKGGNIQQRPGGLFLLKEDGSVEPAKSPKDQARQAAHFLLNELPRILPNGAMPSIHTAVCFPRAYRATHTFQGIEPEEIIYAGEIENIGSRVTQIIAHHQGGARRTQLGSHLVEACKRVLLVPESIGSPTALRVLASESALFELTQEQIGVLRALRRSPRFAVAGGPGTGKTVLAFEQAQWVARQGRRTLLTCFNNPLAARLHQSIPQSLRGHLQVLTFNALHNKLTKSRGLDVDVNAMVNAIADQPDAQYQAVIVDEGQNFKEEWWTVIEFLLQDPEKGELQVFYDNNQSLYEGAHAFPSALIRKASELTRFDELAPPGWASHLLVRNVRNTRQICEASKGLISDLLLEPNQVEGEEIDFRASANPTKEIGKRLIELVRSQVPISEIVVLTGEGRETIKSLEDSGANHFGLIPWTNRPTASDGRLYFETARRYQGLDSPIVLLTDIEPLLDDPAAMLVALTRAKSHLTIFATPPSMARLFSLLGLSPALQGARDAKLYDPFESTIGTANVSKSPVRRATSSSRVEFAYDPFADRVPEPTVPPPSDNKVAANNSRDLSSVALRSGTQNPIQTPVGEVQKSISPLMGNLYSCKIVSIDQARCLVQVRLAANVFAKDFGLLVGEFNQSELSIGRWLELKVASVDPLQLLVPK